MPAGKKTAQKPRASTQASLKRLDGKVDSVRTELQTLDEKINRVAAEMFRRFDAAASKEDAASIQKNLNRITDTLDSISGRLNDQDRTTVVFDKILKDHRIKLEDHETRLTTLEIE